MLAFNFKVWIPKLWRPAGTRQGWGRVTAEIPMVALYIYIMFARSGMRRQHAFVQELPKRARARATWTDAVTIRAIPQVVLKSDCVHAHQGRMTSVWMSNAGLVGTTIIYRYVSIYLYIYT